MHEMSICEGIREVVETHAKTHNASAVRRVRLEIGRFSGVEIPALEFAFETVMRGSVAEGAVLEIIETAGEAICYDCMVTRELEHRLAPCPECGGGRLLPVSGDEMRIKEMEVV